MPQNASRVSRALRTIASNLSQFTEEGESNLKVISALEETWQKIGSTTGKNISLYDEQTGQLKSTYDILYDLNSVWPNLNKNQQNYIAELIAGKNNLDSFNAIMLNFNTAISANETALNSAGSAARENSAYMESLEAKTNAVAESFQRLSNSIVDNDLVALILDVAKGLLDATNTPVGKFALITTAITALTIAVASLWNVMKIGTTVTALFTTGTTIAAGGIAALNLPLIAVIGTLGLLIALAPKIIDFFEDIADPIGRASDKIEENNNQLQANKDRLKELESTPWYDRTSEIQDEIDKLKELNAELQKKNQEEGKKVVSALDTKSRGVYKEGYVVTDAKGAVQTFYSLEDALKAVSKMSGETVNSLDEVDSAIAQVAKTTVYTTGTTRDYYESLVTEQEKFNKIIQEGGQLTADQNTKYQQNISELGNLRVALGNASTATGGLSQEDRDLAKTLNNVINQSERVQNSLKEQARVERIAADGFKITEESAKGLISTNASLSNSIANVNDTFYIEQQALYDLASAGNESAQQMIRDQVALTEEVIKQARIRIEAIRVETEARLGQYGSLDQSGAESQKAEQRNAKKVASDIDLIIKKQEELEKLNAAISSWVPPSSTVGKVSDKGTTTKVDPLEALKASLKESEHEIFLMTKQDALANSDGIIAIYRQMQDAIHTKAEELHVQDVEGNKEAITELQKMWWGYADEIDKVYDSITAAAEKAAKEAEEAVQKHLKKQAEHYQALADEAQKAMDAANAEADAYKIYAQFMVDAIQEKIDKYQAEIDAIEKANEAREEQITLEEKLNNLAKAKQKQVMVFKDGKFQYVKDTEAVSESATDLAEFKRQQQLEREKKYWQNRIDELEDYQDEWKDFTADYDKQANMQILIQSNLFTQEDLIFGKRISSAENFANKYEEAMKKAIAAAEEMKKQQELADQYSGASSGTGGTDWSSLWWEAERDTSLTEKERQELQDYYHQKKEEEMAGSDSKFDPSTGKWTGSGSSGGSSSSSGNKVLGGNKFSPVKKTTGIAGIKKSYAGGTTSASGGLSMVGEQGPELRVLNRGDGILPSDITKNIWELGTNPHAYLSNLLNGFAAKETTSTIYQFDIGSLSLPHATDAKSLIMGLKNMAYQKATART